jgi:hypothetical protein
VVSFTSQPLYLQREKTLYPLNKRLDRPQSQSGLFREDKNLLHLLVIEHQIIHPIAK